MRASEDLDKMQASTCNHCQELLVRLDQFLPKPSKKILSDVVAELIEAKRAANRRERYIKSLKQYLNQFSAGREQLPIDRISSGDIEQWFGARSESASTKSSNLGRLSSLFGYAFRRGYIYRNPCEQVERVRVESATPRILNVEQATELMKRTAPRWRAYVALALFAGIRPEELEKLEWKDVHLDRATVSISSETSKVHLQRTVTLEPNCVAWLRLGGRLPVPRQARRRLLYKLRFILGYDRWPVDVLRHSAATYSLALYQDAVKVAFSLGNSPKILMRHYWSLVSQDEARRFYAISP